MKIGLIVAGLTLTAAGPALAAPPPPPAMSVATFLGKAESLRKKGPLALLSGDIKLLMNRIKADAAVLRSERLVAQSAGKRASSCPPTDGVKLSDKDIMGAMEAVPAPQRPRTSTTEAMRSYMARRFPCRS